MAKKRWRNALNERIRFADGKRMYSEACCCGTPCSHCGASGQTVPDEITIVISGVSNAGASLRCDPSASLPPTACGGCGNVNGTYVLSRLDSACSAGCGWTLDLSGSPVAVCGAGTDCCGLIRLTACLIKTANQLQWSVVFHTDQALCSPSNDLSFDWVWTGAVGEVDCLAQSPFTAGPGSSGFWTPNILGTCDPTGSTAVISF